MKVRNRSRNRFRPLFDTLENRLVPATLTVLNGADLGAGSLRETIAAASSGDTINFSPNVHLVNLTSGELDINKDLIIIGNGANQLSISGTNTSRVFHIENFSTVTISKVTITKGLTTISPTQDPTLVGGGGGLRVEQSGNLTLNNDVVSFNKVVGNLNFDAFGGGMVNLGTVTINSTNFNNNQVTGGGTLGSNDPLAPFDPISGSAGGAIENSTGGILTISNSVFQNNQAIGGDGTLGTSTSGIPATQGYSGIGGAIESDSGLALDFGNPLTAPGAYSTLIVTNTQFLNNLAQGGINGTGAAGALEVQGNYTTLTNCTIANNKAIGGANNLAFAGEGIGGGIQTAVGIINMSGCTVINNQAIGGSNNHAADNGASVLYNSSAFGGGIQNNIVSTLTIDHSTIASNVAMGGNAGTLGLPGYAVGGGIQNGSSGPSGNLIVMSSTIANNKAIAGAGGIAGTYGAANAYGGGIDTQFNGGGSSGNFITSVTNSVISGNVAQGGNGTAGVVGGGGYGGAFDVGVGNTVGADDYSGLALSNSIVIGNQVNGGAGGTGANGGVGQGGAIYMIGNSDPTQLQPSVTLNSTIVALNFAVGGAAGAGGAAGHGSGGGIYNNHGQLLVDFFAFVFANHASSDHNNIYSV